VPGRDWRVVAYLFGDEFKLIGLELVGFTEKRVEGFVETLVDACELNHDPCAKQGNPCERV
jgi:hypothetical protein